MRLPPEPRAGPTAATTVPTARVSVPTAASRARRRGRGCRSPRSPTRENLYYNIMMAKHCWEPGTRTLLARVTFKTVSRRRQTGTNKLNRGKFGATREGVLSCHSIVSQAALRSGQGQDLVLSARRGRSHRCGSHTPIITPACAPRGLCLWAVASETVNAHLDILAWVSLDTLSELGGGWSLPLDNVIHTLDNKYPCGRRLLANPEVSRSFIIVLYHDQG